MPASRKKRRPKSRSLSRYLLPLDVTPTWTSIASFDDKNQTDLASALEKSVKSSVKVQNTSDTVGSAQTLPKTITFPYARHSSYPELCHLVKTFKPKDVWPCTVHPLEWIKHGVSLGLWAGRNLLLVIGGVSETDPKLNFRYQY